MIAIRPMPEDPETFFREWGEITIAVADCERGHRLYQALDVVFGAETYAIEESPEGLWAKTVTGKSFSAP